jgi:hypothetical protein
LVRMMRRPRVPRPATEPLGSDLFQLHGKAEQHIFASEITIELHADRQAVAVEDPRGC